MESIKKYACNDRSPTMTKLKQVYYPFTHYNKFMVKESSDIQYGNFAKYRWYNDFTHKKCIQRFVYTFDPAKYHMVEKIRLKYKTNNTAKGWNVKLIINGVDRLSISKNIYEIFIDQQKEYEYIDVSKALFNTDLPFPICTGNRIELEFAVDEENIVNGNSSIVCIEFNGVLLTEDEYKKYLGTCCEFPVFTYYTQKFHTFDSKVKINKNIPITEIYVFLDNPDGKVSLEHIDLIHKEKGIYSNNCVDKDDMCSVWYPYDWHIKFITSQAYGEIFLQQFNMLQIGKDAFRLMYSLNNDIKSLADLPTCPLTKLKEEEYAEGYWFRKFTDRVLAYDYDRANDVLFPYPKQEVEPDNEFIAKLEKLIQNNVFTKTSYHGAAEDRLGNENMGCDEYSFVSEGDLYIFPEGYLVYLKKYNVHPSKKFRSIIMEM
uniref:Uncharacterized protein n=1 Tax=viral metagenome TaxID=1070528 RepID=A0A6C0EBH2_9ZZZZ